MPGEARAERPWLSRGARTDAPFRLFCFAHAGGGSSFFHPWRAPLQPEIEVCPVVLPGHEARVGERPHTRMEQLLPPLLEGLLPYADRPFAILGHSLGAIVAYEVARRLSASPAGPPRRLFVSGRRAPQVPASRPLLSPLGDAELLDAVAQLNGTPAEVLRQPDLLELFLPSIRADLELNETYVALPGPCLDCPVSAMVGDADPEVDTDEAGAWRETTSGPFSLHVFRGDHFYLQGAPAEVIAAIREDMLVW